MNLLVMGACGLTPDWACEVAGAFFFAKYLPAEQALGIPPRRLARLLAHIRKNLDTPLATSVLSRLAEMKQSHLSKKFKMRTGDAPPQFLLQDRSNRAKER